MNDVTGGQMLEVRSLRKTYGDLAAVSDVSFTLRAGELVGLLGPNGAGKTTTVSMIAGLVDPRSGQVLIEGAPLSGDTDPKKRRIGLVPQDLALYDELSALANLRFFGALYDLDWPRRSSAASNRHCNWSDCPSAPRPRRHLQRRHETTPQPRRGPASRSRHPAARRANGGRRPAEPQRDFREPRGTEGPRQGAALHDALHGGSRASGRPRRDHRPRPGHRGRHARWSSSGTRRQAAVRSRSSPYSSRSPEGR